MRVKLGLGLLTQSDALGLGPRRNLSLTRGPHVRLKLRLGSNPKASDWVSNPNPNFKHKSNPSRNPRYAAT